ncbi:lytic transglycosylase domain-containing protein [Streptomyces sp. R11]|uniref:Lytic transglycosylase domain-containing protein n=1 Tax=Streptomyces sp. R11 TaxID=3238625 RepID=A0AB39NDH3_9ACTN
MAVHFGRRLRKGAAATAVAAAAGSALSASQATGVTVDDKGRQAAADSAPSPEETAHGLSATGNSPYYTDLPPLNGPNPSPSTGTDTLVADATEAGIPATVLHAYKKAAAALRAKKPGCNLPWQLLAAIGRVESGQARGGRVSADGTALSSILGPQLDGQGFALIRDTDNGAYDGNSTYDQAVGPMQFIPSTWQWAGRDGNGDGRKDPNNIYDAALAAGHYLCRYGWDLSNQNDLNRAILSYNNSTHYLRTVLRWLEYYRKGTHEIPDDTGTPPARRSDDSAARPTPPATGGPTPGASSKPARPVSSPTPKPPTAPPTPPGTSPATPTDTVDHLEDGGTTTLTAMAGEAFAKRISTRAETEAGTSVAKVHIRFTVVGDTDTTFTGGERVATAITDSSGVAVAPALTAGEKTGDITVRATVVGSTVPGLDYKATVTERTADDLMRTGDEKLTCTPGGEFADRVVVKATRDGAAAGNVAATAIVIKSPDEPTANDTGPYFKDADGKAVRTLSNLKTDTNGLLKLPQLYADDATGTYLLRITTAGGATLTVELTIAVALPPSPSPTPST